MMASIWPRRRSRSACSLMSSPESSITALRHQVWVVACLRWPLPCAAPRVKLQGEHSALSSPPICPSMTWPAVQRAGLPSWWGRQCSRVRPHCQHRVVGSASARATTAAARVWWVPLCQGCFTLGTLHHPTRIRQLLSRWAWSCQGSLVTATAFKEVMPHRRVLRRSTHEPTERQPWRSPCHRASGSACPTPATPAALHAAALSRRER